MQLGMVGLGRMGANIVRRLMRDGHECVVIDVDRAAVRQLVKEGATGAKDMKDFARKLTPPRTAWVMVPAGITGRVVADVAAHLERGDVVIDGGNSYYRDDIHRAAELAAHGIAYVDVGTSGGVFGLERGFCLMIGGEAKTVKRLDPIFRSLAPGVASAPRTPGRKGRTTTAEHGYLHCGPAGAGHFVKMVHNGIEYGAMAAYAEGLGILRKANAGAADQEHDAETAPLPTRSTTATTSTPPKSPRCGGAAASWPAGCSTSPQSRCSRTRSWRASAGASATAARAGGRCRPPSKPGFPPMC